MFTSKVKGEQSQEESPFLLYVTLLTVSSSVVRSLKWSEEAMITSVWSTSCQQLPAVLKQVQPGSGSDFHALATLPG